MMQPNYFLARSLDEPLLNDARAILEEALPERERTPDTTDFLSNGDIFLRENSIYSIPDRKHGQFECLTSNKVHVESAVLTTCAGNYTSL
ncbi:hypothetical protein M513_05747 [Trichuris suis]|uniref:Uncharacterized protein n=1 Tax=Trichuris suis TaxID=68888 RepID=A0A085M7S0_9BILA|nr:hypothetical protein M513_05747 [Trichuris suis]